MRDLLSLPESITENAPLFQEVEPGSWADHYNQLSDNEQKYYLAKARDNIFWAKAGLISLVPKNKLRKLTKPGIKRDREDKVIKGYSILPSHPLVFALSERLEKYLGLPDETIPDGPMS